MKKILKISAVVLALLVAILILTPLLFKGKIIEIARHQINKNVNAKVEFSDVRVSLIRNFPNLHVAITDLSVSGTEDFVNDTLVSFDAFRSVVSLMSLVRGEGVNVVSVVLDRPLVKTRVLEDGSANWNIMVESEEELPPDQVAEPAQFKVNLKSFEIRRGRFIYDDAPYVTKVSLDNLNLHMKGDMTQDLTSLDIDASASAFNIWYDDFRYISDADIVVNTLMDADLNDFRFTFTGGDLLLNNLAMGVDGYFALPSGGIEMDLDFYSVETGFETLLSLVPAIFMAGMDDIETSGEISVEGFVRGFMGGGVMPSAGLEVMVDKGSFSYPGFPASADNIRMEMGLLYDGEDEDRSFIDLKSFHVELAGNPFNMKLNLTTPVSDPRVDAMMEGRVDLGKISDIMPLEGIDLMGVMDASVAMAGVLSDIENERYEDFMANGHLELTGFRYEGNGLPYGVGISDARLDFSPRYVEMPSMEMVMGNTDMAINGRLENFIPYLFSGGVVHGNLSLTSSLADLNELLAFGAGEPEKTDTLQLSIIEIPSNVDFTFTSSIEKAYFGEMEMSDIRGVIRIADSRAVMENVSMNMLGGSVAVSGEYNTAGITEPFVDFSMDVNSFDIPSAFNTFNTVQALTPVAKDLRGAFSVRMNFRSILESDFTPVMNSINAGGGLQTSRVEVVSSTTFDRIASVLKLSEGTTNVLRDIDLNFRLQDGRLSIDPVNFSMGPVDMMLAGDQGLDRTMNYAATMRIPRSAFGEGAGELIDDLVSRASSRGIDMTPGEYVNVDLKITGTFSDPRISVDPGEGIATAATRIIEQVAERASGEIERRAAEAETAVREDLSARAEKIMEEAERRAEQVKNAAGEAAEKVIKEAEQRAVQIEKEAEGRGRLAELAAGRTADRIREEAQNSAKKIISEADARAEQILEEARKEVEKLKEEE